MKTNQDQDARYFYYDHGPLARVKLGENQVQGLDYAYTLQGWLKGINSNTLVATRDMGQDGHIDVANPNASFAKDVYGLTLGYFSGDYKPIDAATKWNTTTSRFEASLAGSDLLGERYDLYNGNIGHMVNTITNTADQSAVVLGNAYTYDQLHRINSSRTYDNINASTNVWGAGSTYEGMYENTFVYDASGNIERQLRKDIAGAPIDSLTYRYEEGAYGRKRNRLYHVKDIVPDGDFDDDIDNMGPYTASDPNSVSSNNNYRYDELGQLVYDAQEEIGAIDWRNDGKIRSIMRIGSSPDPDLVFDYDPSGNRLSKKVFNATGQLLYTNYYLRDAQGNVMATYKRPQEPRTRMLEKFKSAGGSTSNTTDYSIWETTRRESRGSAALRELKFGFIKFRRANAAAERFGTGIIG